MRIRVTPDEAKMFGIEPLLLGGWIAVDSAGQDPDHPTYYWTHASLELAAQFVRRFADVSQNRAEGKIR